MSTMADGWIKIQRSLTEDELYFSEKFSKIQAWIDILLLAEYRPREIYVRSVPLKLEKGQAAVSIRDLAQRWKWGVNRVQAFLKELVEFGKIDTHKRPLISVITVLGYETYEVGEYEVMVKADTLTDTPTDTLKNGDNLSKNQRLTNDKNNDTDTPIDTLTNTPTPANEPKNTLIDTQTDTLKLEYNISNFQGLTSSYKDAIDTLTDTPTDTLKKKKNQKENIINNNIISTSFFDKKEDGLPYAQMQDKIKEQSEVIEKLQQEVDKLKAPKKSKEKKVNPLITLGREVFEKKYQELFETSYYWQAKDAVAMGSLTKKLKYARKEKNLGISDEEVIHAFSIFLETIKDEWILKNFTVTTLDSKYNEIVSQARANKNIANGNKNKSVADATQRADAAASIVSRLLAEDDANC